MKIDIKGFGLMDRLTLRPWSARWTWRAKGLKLLQCVEKEVGF